MMSAVSSVNIFARHRTFGVADQRGDRHLGEAEIVGDAGKSCGAGRAG